MDIYGLINSKAIQDHCRKIKHKFNILELTVLIYRNKKMSVEEKICAYKKLITDYEDMKIIKNYRTENHNTVKEMIKSEIERVEKLVEILKRDEEDIIYTYNYYCKNSYSIGIVEGQNEYNNIYRKFKEVKNAIEEEIKEDEENEILSFFIRKRTLREHKDNFEIKADYILDENRNLKLINVYDLKSGYLDINMFCINLPVPFKRGDLLVSTSYSPFYEGSFLDMQKFPFVLENLITWRENFQELLDKGNYDSSDMEGTGYFITEDGKLCYDNVFDYDSWEYFEGELKGSEKLLKGVSNLIKDQIGIELFLQGYEYIKAENNLSLDIYTKDGLELAGLSENDIKTLEFRKKLK